MAEFIIKSDDRALFYSPMIGKRRVYRSSTTSPQKGLKLLVYKRKSRADQICQEVNEVYNDTFEVVEKP